jgi:hypothetical protein
LALLLPIHDWPAMIEGGQVVARLRDSVPGPIVLVKHSLITNLCAWDRSQI